jgi:hypothetical protein
MILSGDMTNSVCSSCSGLTPGCTNCVISNPVFSNGSSIPYYGTLTCDCCVSENIMKNCNICKKISVDITPDITGLTVVGNESGPGEPANVNIAVHTGPVSNTVSCFANVDCQRMQVPKSIDSDGKCRTCQVYGIDANVCCSAGSKECKFMDLPVTCPLD